MKSFTASVTFVEFIESEMFRLLMIGQLAFETAPLSREGNAAYLARDALDSLDKVRLRGFLPNLIYMSRFDVFIASLLIGEPRLAFPALDLLDGRVFRFMLEVLLLAEGDVRTFLALMRHFAKVRHVQVIKDVVQISLLADRTSVRELLTMKLQHMIEGRQHFSAKSTVK